MNESAARLTGRISALLILGLAIWAVISVLIAPIIGAVLAEQRWRAGLASTASSFAALIARREIIVRELDQIGTSRRAAPPLWKDASDVSLAATMEGLVRSYISADGQALSVTSEAPFSERGLRHIGLHVDMTMTIPGLTSFLEHVRTARPELFIDRLSVTAPPASDPNQPPRINLECDIAAFAEAKAGR